MLSIEAVGVAYEGAAVLHGVDLTVAQGEIVTLLGPSGCGKTTLLRAVAGLEPIQGGDIRIHGQSMQAVPVHARGFGLMFQAFALFPHMTVADNVRFGLKMQRLPRAQQAERVEAMLSLVGLAGYGERDVAQLSGGEQQRVALARSLAPNPRLLMLDEPLGALDAALKDRLMVDLRTIIKSVGLTALYVTHDQQEAFAISDRVAVMNAGVIEQIAPPDVLYRRPETVFVAQFLGLNNIFSMSHPVIARLSNVPQAEAVLLHPDDVRLAENGEIVGRVVERVYQGRAYRLKVGLDDGATLILHVNHAAPDVGATVNLAVDPAAIIPLAA
jgi:ABC-type Fe3+/spermidine/putrescine transport system ATPase subunit